MCILLYFPGGGAFGNEEMLAACAPSNPLILHPCSQHCLHLNFPILAFHLNLFYVLSQTDFIIHLNLFVFIALRLSFSVIENRFVSLPLTRMVCTCICVIANILHV